MEQKNACKSHNKTTLTIVPQSEVLVKSLLKQFTTNTDSVLCRSSVDAEIDFDKVCRTCFTSSNIKFIFGVMYDNMYLSDILKQCASIEVDIDDKLPKHICDDCILELIKCYRFRKKCIQTQFTFDEILRYNKTDSNTFQNQIPIQIPFVLNEITMKNSSQAVSIERKKKENSKQGIQKQGDYIPGSASPNQTINLSHNIATEENDVAMDVKKNEENSNKHLNLEKSHVNGYDIPLANLINDMVQIETEMGKCATSAKKMNKVCDKCNEVFKTLAELRNHRKERNHGPLRRKDACNLCGKQFDLTHLKIHMRSHTKEKPYKCRICCKGFSLNCNLKRHIMTHTGERPYICDICGKGFIQSVTLEEHKRMHTGETPFVCSYCGKTFKQSFKHRMHLRHHLIVKEENAHLLKEHQCNVCYKLFFSKSTLKTHKLTHGEKSYLCSHCGKGFYSNSGLLSHLKVHSGDRPYSCSKCGKSFSQVGSLKSHLLIHSGVRPYKCHICSKTFVQRSHLKYHIRIHSGEKPYVCSYCGKAFSLNGTLTVHIRTHTGETPYICNICGRGFYDSSSMKRHRRGHNNVDYIVNDEDNDDDEVVTQSIS